MSLGVSGLSSSGVSVAFRHIYLHTTSTLDVPSVVEGALLQCQKAFYAVVKIIAFVRMRKELSHVGQALMVPRIFQLQKSFNVIKHVD